MGDFFARLDLPRTFTLDLAEVERRYLLKSREHHPDFHANAAEAERRMAELNEAYIALKDPFRRVEHLLSLSGGPAASQEKSLDQAFLMEMMEIRERIEAASDRTSIEAELQARLHETLSAAGRPFDENRTLTTGELTAIRRQLNSAKTLISLLRDL